MAILRGVGSVVRSNYMIFMRGFRKRDTIQYPEQPVYLPPRYRGRIVLTRDPDGEERCVAVAGIRNSSGSTSRAASSAVCARRHARPRPSS
jgi:hypothetical protein